MTVSTRRCSASVEEAGAGTGPDCPGGCTHLTLSLTQQQIWRELVLRVCTMHRQTVYLRLSGLVSANTQDPY